MPIPRRGAIERSLAAAAAVACLLSGMSPAHADITANAAKYRSVHVFSEDSSRRSGGAYPSGPMIEAPDGLFYGVTAAGGKHGEGALYSMTPGGKVRTLASFNARTGTAPAGPLTWGSDGMLYGVTRGGGKCDTCGTIFRATTAGQLEVLHKMRSTEDGATPNGSLVEMPDGNFYGTAQQGGQWGSGTIFRLTPQGRVELAHSFYPPFDGPANPSAGLMLASDGVMYGTTRSGGIQGAGTIYSFSPDTGMSLVYPLTRAQGAFPRSRLVEGPDGYLYGTAPLYGFPVLDSFGTIFRVSKQGDFKVLVNFNGTNGMRPSEGLALASNGSFYGATYEGGFNDFGTLFRMRPSGEISVVHTFIATDGSHPVDEPVQGSDGILRGTTTQGGWNLVGVAYELKP